MITKPEILAPAGSPEALVAAVRCGADAVYLGAASFNARRNAANFSPTQLKEAVAFCHARGVAVHLTLNTLVRDDELEEALRVAVEAGEMGVDALIVQDVGLARRLHAAMPQMPLHASTQLSCHTPAGVDFLRDVGFSRVVLSREMTKEEIAACVGRGCEIEVFVHGALCMSVSGQCYLSALLGGRSGNRGLCAQPCRLPFSTESGKGEAALSLKDTSLLDHIPALSALGVDAFKIEGRMKRPEYVAAAVTAYRRQRDGEPLDAQLVADLQNVFSRSGFTDGYFTDKRGVAMFGVRRPEDARATADALSRLTPLYRNERQSVPVTLALTVAPQTPVTLTATDADGNSATVTGAPPEAVRTAPLSRERITEQLQKSGGTPFAVIAVDIQDDPTVTATVGALNALRREALATLLQTRAQITPKAYTAAVPPVTPAPPIPFARVVRLQDAAQYSGDASAADLWIIPADTPVERVTIPVDRLGVELPRGMFGGEAHYRDRLRVWKAAGVKTVLCGHIGAVRLAQEEGLSPLGGFGLNITNRAAAAFWAENGAVGSVGSFELTFAQWRTLAKDSALPLGLFVYGRQPMMLTRNCPRRCAGASCADCDGGGLVDRKGLLFPTRCTGSCTELFNTVRLELADKRDQWPHASFYYWHFTDETAAETARVLSRYARGEASDTVGTKGLYHRGVE
ncbi:MAG: U32 family peptidase [Clostridia bacterium]|nr:U32 family peptidase [Clostridia bacterium]